MNVFRNADEINRDIKTVLTVGTFDGVHSAHRKIIDAVLETAGKTGSRSFLVTFDPHPQEVLKTKSPDIKLLNTTEEKLEILSRMGIGNVLLIKFTEDFAKTSARDFYENLVYNKIGISHLVVGFDHLFGRNREGDYNTLLQFGKELMFTIEKVGEIDINGDKVSSSKIRRYLAEGNIVKANKLLGYRYTLSGNVVAGDRIGRQLGFPTANIKPVTDSKLIPGDGVYAVKLRYKGADYSGMMNIGFRPTISRGNERIIEVNIFDFNKEINGEQLTVEFIDRLRNEKKFSSKDELIEQLNIDKKNSLNILKQHYKIEQIKETKCH